MWGKIWFGKDRDACNCIVNIMLKNGYHGVEEMSNAEYTLITFGPDMEVNVYHTDDIKHFHDLDYQEIDLTWLLGELK